MRPVGRNDVNDNWRDAAEGWLEHLGESGDWGCTAILDASMTRTSVLFGREDIGSAPADQ
tara:strand:+ start:5333 stop:5512 length:180 start_codon:yes stop_codon:yes gene_type:complete